MRPPHWQLCEQEVAAVVDSLQPRRMPTREPYAHCPAAVNVHCDNRLTQRAVSLSLSFQTLSDASAGSGAGAAAASSSDGDGDVDMRGAPSSLRATGAADLDCAAAAAASVNGGHRTTPAVSFKSVSPPPLQVK